MKEKHISINCGEFAQPARLVDIYEKGVFWKKKIALCRIDKNPFQDFDYPAKRTELIEVNLKKIVYN